MEDSIILPIYIDLRLFFNKKQSEKNFDSDQTWSCEDIVPVKVLKHN